MRLFLLFFVFAQGIPGGDDTPDTPAVSDPPAVSQENFPYVLGMVLVQYDDDTFSERVTENEESEDIQIPGGLLDDDSSPVTVVDEFFEARGIDSEVIEVFPDLQAEVIYIGEGVDPLLYMEHIAALPGVLLAQPNFLFEFIDILSEEPDNQTFIDSQLADMWHLQAIKVYDPNAATDAWDLLDAHTHTYTPKVAVIDDGVLTTYADFIGRIPDWECKLPEFAPDTSAVEETSYTPQTGNCTEGGVGFGPDDRANNQVIVTNYDVDHSSATTASPFHGTKVASILAANRNAVLAAGVADFVELIPVRLAIQVDQNDSSRYFFDTVTIVRAITFAKVNDDDTDDESGIGIINASFRAFHDNVTGGCSSITAGSRSDLMYQQAGNFEGLFVAAAGNDDTRTGDGNTTFVVPADFNQDVSFGQGSCWTGLSNMITVGGTEQDNNDVNGDGSVNAVESALMGTSGVIGEVRWSRDWQRSDGSWVGSNYNSKVDIAAPAKSILVPASSSATVLTDGNGTSLAAPQVAGALALMKRANSSLPDSELKDRLLESADELITLVGPDCEPGTPDDYVERGRRLNAYNAVRAALDTDYTAFEYRTKTITDAEKLACKMCVGGTQTWTVGGNTCTATLPSTVAHNATGSLTDTTGSTIGLADYSCDVGTLTLSNESCTSCTNATTPAAPTATAGNGSCTITENDPGTDYSYRIRQGSGSWYTMSSKTFTGLTNGISYTFSIQRKNSTSSCTAWSSSTAATCTPVECTTSHTQCGDAEYCSACDSLGTCSGSGTCESCTWGNRWCNTNGSKAQQSCKVGDDTKRYKTVETCSEGCFNGICTGCDADTTSRSWTADGNTCTGGELSSGSSGDSQTLTDTSGTNQGSATYLCSIDTWAKTESSCGEQCTAETINNCSLAASNHNETVTGSCAMDHTGNCSYTCNDGSWTNGTNTCTVSSQSCTSHSDCSGSSQVCNTVTGNCISNSSPSSCSTDSDCSTGLSCTTHAYSGYTGSKPKACCPSGTTYWNDTCGAPCSAETKDNCSVSQLNFGYYAGISYARCTTGYTGSCGGAYSCKISGGPISVRDASLNTCQSCTVSGCSSWGSIYSSSSALSTFCGTQTVTQTCASPTPSGCTGSYTRQVSRTGTLSCPSGQTCSNNSCVSTPTTSSCTGYNQCGDAEYCSACDSLGTCSGSGTCESCTWGNRWCNTNGSKAQQSCKVGDDTKRYKTVETCSEGCFNGICTGCDADTTSRSWTADGNTCTGGELSSGSSADSQTLTDTSGTNQGSATYLCFINTWVKTESSCTAQTQVDCSVGNPCNCGSTSPWCTDNDTKKWCYCTRSGSSCIKAWGTEDCASGETCSGEGVCASSSDCSVHPCHAACRSVITWGSCHNGHTHSSGYQHTQRQRHGWYTCHGSTEKKWKSEDDC